MIKVGDKVVISLTGKLKYKNTLSDPHGSEGTLLEDDGDTAYYCYYVDWGNGYFNSYQIGELEIPSHFHSLENK